MMMSSIKVEVRSVGDVGCNTLGRFNRSTGSTRVLVRKELRIDRRMIYRQGYIRMVYVEDCWVLVAVWLNGPSDGDTTVIYGLHNVVSGIRSTFLVHIVLCGETTIFQLPEILPVPLSTRTGLQLPYNESELFVGVILLVVENAKVFFHKEQMRTTRSSESRI